MSSALSRWSLPERWLGKSARQHNIYLFGMNENYISRQFQCKKNIYIAMPFLGLRWSLASQMLKEWYIISLYRKIQKFSINLTVLKMANGIFIYPVFGVEWYDFWRPNEKIYLKNSHKLDKGRGRKSPQKWEGEARKIYPAPAILTEHPSLQSMYSLKLHGTIILNVGVHIRPTTV